MDLHRKIDFSLYGDSDLPEYPARKLIIHVLVKGLQLGSVLGLFALTPGIAFYYRKRLSIKDAFRYIVPVSTISGGLSSLGLLYGKYYQGDLSSNDGVDDRAYRLHKNAGQNQVDRYSFIGFMSGSAASTVCIITTAILIIIRILN